MRRVAAALSFATLATAGCHNSADLIDTARPALRSVLELRTRQMRGDTMQLTVTLGSGPTTSLGSLTGEVLRAANWRFVSCDAAQGTPLLACKEHETGVKVAAAWPAGTNAGALLTLTFVRTTPSATPGWQLALQEAHGVSGHSLADSLDVRREVTP
jgi:hypothetical protein